MSAVYGATYYLPIYFQAINSATAIMSGVYLLPTILPQLVVAASSGLLCKTNHILWLAALTYFAVMKIGYVVPLALLSTVLLSIASGLYSLLQPESPTGHWVGFQILAGIGSGAGLQVVRLYDSHNCESQS